MSGTPLQRGDVVIVDYSLSVPAAQIRPALIVQNDRDNQRTNRTIVVQLTSNLQRAHEDTHLLIGTNHPDWHASGLKLPSVINTSNINSILQDDVVRVIGCLSPRTMQDVDDCLRAALALC